MKGTLPSIILFVWGIVETNSISTIHHDKPEAVTVSNAASTTAPDEIGSSTATSSFNVTLSPTERKKRLLPYRHFYSSQPFNRPHQAEQYYKDYEDARSVFKNPEYKSQNYRTKDVNFRSPSQRFTPFSENNALPGHFRPMMPSNKNHPDVQYAYLDPPPPPEIKYQFSKEEPLRKGTGNKSPSKVQYVYFKTDPREEDRKRPPADFSAIYEKLSQLKFRQQELHNKEPYGYRLVPHQRYRERPLKHQEYRPTTYDAGSRFKINPSKTTIETFTATNIDIPEQTRDGYDREPPRYHQFPTPTKEQLSMNVPNNYGENNKPFIHNQVAIEVPQSSLQLTFSPGLARNPSSTKEGPRKPSIFLQQGNSDTKQPVLILRKTKPSVVVDESFVAEKFTLHVPSKPRTHHQRPVFVLQEPQYKPSPFYDAQYQATPAPFQQKYEKFTAPSSSPSYNQLEYGAKLTQQSPKVSVVTESTPNYGEENKYYHYQTVSPGNNVGVSPATVDTSLRESHKVFPQYHEYEHYHYQTTSPGGPEGVSPATVKTPSNVAPQYQENEYYHFQTPSPGVPEGVSPATVKTPSKVSHKVAPQYQENEYYHYQTPSPGSPEGESPVTVETPSKESHKVAPQYQDNEYYHYQTPSPGSPEGVSPVAVGTPLRESQYQEEDVKATPKAISQYYHDQEENSGVVRVEPNKAPQYPPPDDGLRPQLLNQYQEEPQYHLEEYSVTPQTSKTASGSVGNTNSLSEILRQLQESNTLPQTLTPDNIDNSIKTLVKILNVLRDRQKQHKPVAVQDEYQYDNEAGVDLGGEIIDSPDGGTPGKPGVDYPALSTIPKTSFNCKTQRYKGFFGDPDTNCQVWHYCDLNGGQASFLCPNGTIFSQVALTCDWWYNVKCSSTAQLYVLNERLYKYIIPLSPKFPEDYSGPLVDKYLALKFQEMEEKLRRQKKGKGNKDSKDADVEEEENSERADDEKDATNDETQTVGETERPPTEEGVESVETSTISPNFQ